MELIDRILIDDLPKPRCEGVGTKVAGFTAEAGKIG